MNRLSDFRADLLSPKMFRAVAVGFLLAAIIVIHCLALGAIIFNGPLLPFAVQDTGMMLFGAIVFCLLIGGASSYSGMLAYPQEIPATVLGTLGAGVVASTASAGPETAFTTMVALLILSCLLTGLFFPDMPLVKREEVLVHRASVTGPCAGHMGPGSRAMQARAPSCRQRGRGRTPVGAARVGELSNVRAV